MERKADPISRAVHRRIGGDLFNYTWTLLARSDRAPGEDDEMLHAAHASRFHWGHAGTPLNLSVGEWQISRVYAVLERSEPALHHARRALEIARQGRLGPFYRAYAHEALARAAAVAERSSVTSAASPGTAPASASASLPPGTSVSPWIFSVTAATCAAGSPSAVSSARTPSQPILSSLSRAISASP